MNRNSTAGATSENALFDWTGVTARSGWISPLLWHHGEDASTIRREIEAIRASGIRSFVLEPRPHPDYLGAKWWADVEAVIEIAQSLGMSFWLFDDGKFPSGHAGGRVPAKYPHLLKRFLAQSTIDVTGPHPHASFAVDDWLSDDDEVLAVAAYRRVHDDTVDESSIIDLTDLLSDGRVSWAVPDGRWRVAIITKTSRGGEAATADYLNPVDPLSAATYIDLIHSQHYARFAAHFGSTILGFFQDEPRFGNVESYVATLGARWLEFAYTSPVGPSGNHEVTLPFSDPLFADVLARVPRAHLPLLWFDSTGDLAGSTRLVYMDAASTRFADYLGALGQWCRQHGVGLIGHLIEDSGAHARLGYGPGHYFRAIRSQSAAGIDVVSQIFPGETEGRSSSPFGYLDNEFFYWGLAKMASSAAHLDPTTSGMAMVEAFGAYGWQLGLPLMKWLTDHLVVRGINYFVPHAFSPKVPDPDCPPHFFNGGLNPQWDYFAHWVSYTQNLCERLSGGTHVADVAVVYHAEAEWVAPASGFETVLHALAVRQIDADVVPVDALRDATVQGGRLLVGSESFGALVLPQSTLIDPSVAAVIERLRVDGLEVVVVGEPPRLLGTELRLQARSCELGELVEVLYRLGIAAPVLASDEPDLRLYHYVKGASHSYFCLNESTTRALRVDLAAPTFGTPRVVDLQSGRATVPAHSRVDGRPLVHLALVPGESVLIEFDKTAATTQMFVSTSPIGATVGHWRLSIAESRVGPFMPFEATRGLGDLALAGLSRFAGSIRYETQLLVPPTGVDAGATVLLDLGEIHDIAEVSLNGVAVGIRIAPPYVFELPALALRDGVNDLVVTVTTNLARAEGSNTFDRARPLGAIGLLGPVSVIERTASPL